MQKEKKPIIFWILAGAILLLTIIFSVQNLESTTVRFLSVDIEGPLVIIIASVFLLGYLLGRIWSIILNKNKKKRKRQEDTEKQS